MKDLRNDDPNGDLEGDRESHAERRLAVPRIGVATASDLNSERPYLLALARRLALTQHDADDLVQDAIVRALPALGKVATGAHLRAWLLTILRRIHIDRRRRTARVPESVSLDDVHNDALVSDDSDDVTAQATIEREDTNARDVHAALHGLPEPFRQVLVLHELEGHSYREIADALNLPLSTVGTRLNRGRLKLRDLLAVKRSTRAE
jgi:RNA polymerase sigma-70 factor (ECF subfamily)